MTSSLPPKRPEVTDLEWLIVGGILLQHRDMRVNRRRQELACMSEASFEQSIEQLEGLIWRISPTLAEVNGCKRPAGI